VELSKEQVATILRVASLYVDYPYKKNFQCVDFVRRVYGCTGIKVPILKADTPPPREFNITKEQLKEPPPGHILFLKDRSDPRKNRKWTHVVIIMPGHRCIHCSLFLGRQVAISSLYEMFKRYDFAASNTA